jgi:cellulose synthase/poly-beta-1,6-N-acetylglucosamine synthase-like glycosyltransferase
MISRIIVLALSSTVTLLFFVYGFNCYYLLAARRRYRSPVAAGLDGPKPAVSVHLPVYNEKYVIGRLLDAVAHMAAAYGIDKVSILVLDDSDDDTRDEVDRHVARHAGQGLQVEVLRRSDRAGYKAGALRAALERTRGRSEMGPGEIVRFAGLLLRLRREAAR